MAPREARARAIVGLSFAQLHARQCLPPSVTWVSWRIRRAGGIFPESYRCRGPIHGAAPHPPHVRFRCPASEPADQP